MENNILKNAKKLRNDDLKNIVGGVGGGGSLGTPYLYLCGCSCTELLQARNTVFNTSRDRR
ncbi:hypothetical protein SAMN05880574_11363 [Chryseobacterium sp. RU37D]|uniref:hypothetical protein n=1 Tax=Chryseobacterium sp. RU37D TaxID=1907397 RepID=UPI000954F6F9|nr:hypothetical protein [Chryseobacterium sp. RU37D]SIQ45801.1 hypothetical protein SAMN05880574_11363 [Chryseobacterium sp. RU37D]